MHISLPGGTILAILQLSTFFFHYVHLVHGYKWRQITSLLVLTRLDTTPSLMKSFQNTITIHRLR